MAKNFVQTGANLTLPVTKAVKSGDPVKVGEIVGVALTDAKTDDGTDYYTTVATEGVFALPITADVEAGAKVTVAPANGGDAAVFGFATEAAKKADGTANVKLAQGITAAATTA